MTTITDELPERHAMGKSMKRKEDPRLIRGKGNYLDDIVLPHMLYLALVHSPYPHARIKKIDKTAALASPGVKAVITGEDLVAAKLGWLPTFHSLDQQMVLAIGKALYQYQEVAGVIATSRKAAIDAVELVDVEYEPLDPVVSPFDAIKDKILVREDREAKTNHIYHWQVGDKDKTEAELAKSDVRIKERILSPRCHPAPLEPCGAIADMNRATGRLTVHLTSQAPHVHRTAFSIVTGIPEDKIHIISPDIGGGFGNKVPVYPGYVVATVASVILGVPVKWVETRTENLTCTGFARDYHMDVEIGATKAGNVFPTAFAEVDAYFTNKAPGGVAYRCSFRVTEASYAIERAMNILAQKLGLDQVELRRMNFIQKDQFPYPSPLGFVYDSGDYEMTMDKALGIIGYKDLLREQAEKRARGEYMGIGISTFTEIVGAGPGKNFDILGIKMFDSAEIRIHPTGSGIVRAGTRHQGQGHETTWAQIVAEELGLDPQELLVEEGDTDTAPYGLGTYASRSTPVAGAALALASRKIRDKARKIAAHLLEASEDDVQWQDYKFSLKGVPGKSVTMKEVAFAAYTNPPPDTEPGLEATYYYDPPNLTFPYGTYIAVVEVDAETGAVQVRRFLAVDDCGTIINPMIVQGQVHGGLAEGFAIAFMQEIKYDDEGNNLNTDFTEYLIPTALETPNWETAHTVTPSPHHPIGAKGVGESPTVGSPQAFTNAVIDALSPLGITHIDVPLTREKVWRAIREAQAK